MIVQDTPGVRFFVVPTQEPRPYLGAPVYAVLPNGAIYIVDRPARISLRYETVDELLRDKYYEVPDLETAVRSFADIPGPWWQDWRICLSRVTMQTLRANWQLQANWSRR